ncbi:MAG: winged helix-turn-helix transcriptional regulator [Candidatus Nitrosocaldus sp.]
MNRQNISKSKPFPLIEVENRYIIFNAIKNMPGIRYMELKRLTGLSYGTLTYHLTRLEREGRIRIVRSARKSRYYTSDVDDSQADIIECIRSRTCKGILAMILEHGTVTLDALARTLNKAKTTIKYHIDMLKARGIIEGERIGRYIFYHVRDEIILNRIRDALLTS